MCIMMAGFLFCLFMRHAFLGRTSNGERDQCCYLCINLWIVKYLLYESLYKKCMLTNLYIFNIFVQVADIETAGIDQRS